MTSESATYGGMGVSVVANITKHAVLYLLGSLLLWYIEASIQSWYRLRKYPGPFLAKFSCIFMAKTQRSGVMNLRYTEVNTTYGTIARIGPNELLTNDPELIRRMSSARSQYKRSDWYSGVRTDPKRDNLMSELDVHTHDKRRAQMASAYAGKENPTLESDIDDRIATLVSLIRQKYVSHGGAMQPMDLARKIQFFTLDVITQLAYGKPFGYLEGDHDVYEYVKNSEALIGFLATMMGMPLLMKFMDRTKLISLFAPTQEDPKGLGRMMRRARDVVSERLDLGKSKADMLGAWIRNGIPQRQIEAEVIFQVIAGSDTTATALRSTLLRLLTTPRICTKLRKEMDTAIAEGKISSPITNAEARKLPYLQAVVREGLRMNPPFTGLLAKEVPPGGDTYNGHYLPAGTRVAHSTWSVSRHPIFGADVEVFRPERWMEADANVPKMEQNLDLLFGHGRWGCLGKPIAYMQMNKIYVEMLRNFDFDIMNANKPWISQNFNLWKQHDMWVRVSERGST
ncbi:cytochrome P450 [Dothidotthia symphoricarpi CBS 119687]|uniref:Cytochrome P450 monooxygenase ABA1 n=1 Tax=Dothidotthia symphoricarpi CBS 119687 TaxID=1392245 RepID=A0A6A6AMA8_9PLEO|nr:cytochrome P450 [Dothidotthia symphoricarpi CBS 119687]KAF2132268.1 cytochrome P450 [Dothidotthia symphoricarpi CBS 119687]